MNGHTRRAVAARTRALTRLRSITIGTTVAGLAGVAGFGTIAAISNSGAPSTGIGDAGAGTTVITTTVSNDGNGAVETTTTTTTTTSLTATATPRPVRGRGHVTTGSS